MKKTRRNIQTNKALSEPGELAGLQVYIYIEPPPPIGMKLNIEDDIMGEWFNVFKTNP